MSDETGWDFVSVEEYEQQIREGPWPDRLRYKLRLGLRLRTLSFTLRHPRMAWARRNGRCC